MCFANTYLWIWTWTCDCGSVAFRSFQPVFSSSVFYLYLPRVFPLCPGERADPHTLTHLSCFHDNASVFTIHRFHLSNSAAPSESWSLSRGSPLHYWVHALSLTLRHNSGAPIRSIWLFFWKLYTRASDAEEGIKGRIRINNVTRLEDCSSSFSWEDDQLAASVGWEDPAM